MPTLGEVLEWLGNGARSRLVIEIGTGSCRNRNARPSRLDRVHLVGYQPQQQFNETSPGP